MEEWRTFLYPLGFISVFFFGLRFIIQWIQSEIKGESTVSPIFWYFSLIGNVSLALHTFIQAQFPICLVQACNAVISWRNIDIMQTKRRRVSFNFVVQAILLTIFFVTIAFWIQSHFFLSHIDGWFRVPKAPWDTLTSTQVSWLWHLLGTIGYILFSSRFWVQWWYAEKHMRSELPISFWWLSLLGALFSCAYFIKIHDLVNLIGPLIGLVPYIRNLMLIYKINEPIK